MAPHPLGELGGGAAGVKLDFGPVGLLEELGVGEAEFLGAGVAGEAGRACVSLIVMCRQKLKWINLPEANVSADGVGDGLLATDLQTRSDGDGVFDGLGSTVTGSGEERVGGVTDLDDACVGGGPAGLGVPPEELEVDDRLGGGALDELLEYGCPLGWAGDVVHGLEDLVGFDGVVP